MYGERLQAKEVAIREMNSLRGRLCSIIESANLPQKQEKALITLIKNLSYQNQSTIVDLIDALDDGREFKYVSRKIRAVE